MQSLEEILDIANILIDNNKLSEAVAHLDTAINHYPRHAELYDLRGIVWCRLLKTERSIADFETAIAIDAMFDLACFHLAEISIHEQNYEKADTYLQEAIKIAPENLFYTVNLAFIKLLRKEYESCIEICNQVLNEDPSNKDAMEYRAECFMQLKLYKAGAADYEVICINSPDNPVLYNNTGYCYSKAGNIEKAKYYLSKATLLDPGFSYPYDNLGYVYYLENNYKKAHELIDKSIEMDPSNSYAYKNKALVLIAEGDQDNARNYLRKAQALQYELLYGDEVNELLRMMGG